MASNGTVRSGGVRFGLARRGLVSFGLVGCGKPGSGAVRRGQVGFARVRHWFGTAMLGVAWLGFQIPTTGDEQWARLRRKFWPM